MVGILQSMRLCAVAFHKGDCYGLEFAVSAVKSMRIVRVGCCDSEAVCAVRSLL